MLLARREMSNTNILACHVSGQNQIGHIDPKPAPAHTQGSVPRHQFIDRTGAIARVNSNLRYKFVFQNLDF
jgi:hypothetical protein